MKKIFVLTLMMILLASVVSGAGAAPAGPPGSGWWTSITIQNVSGTSANVSVNAYGSDGSTPSIASIALADKAAITYNPNSFTGMASGFQGGAIVSSDQSVTAIANVTNRYTAGLGDSGTPHAGAAQYQGTSAPATTLYFPMAKYNYYSKTSTFYIQNAGSNATTFTATFRFAGSTYTYTSPSFTVGKTIVFTAADATGAPSGNTNGLGSLVVTSNSSEPLAGVVLEHATTEVHGTLLQAARSFTPADASTTIYAPMNKNNYFNRFSGFQIQNIGTGNVDITVTYTVSNNKGGCAAAVGSTTTDSATNVAPYAAFTSKSATAFPNNCMTSAKAVATLSSGSSGTVAIAGIVNEAFTTAYLAANPSKYQEATMYAAFPESAATLKVSIPIFKEDSYDKAGTIIVQNISAFDAHVTLVFTSTKGTFTSVSQTIPANGSMDYLDVRLNAAAFWSGTAMTPAALGCTSGNYVCGAGGQMAAFITSSDQNIVALLNESTYPISSPRMQMDKNNYEGFNLP
jgi:hypothetical protein